MSNNYDKYVEKAKQILLNYFVNSNIKIYLFGSRATGNERVTSDIDIAVEGTEHVSLKTIGELQEIFEDSNIPYEVDIVDLNVVNEDFKKAILKEAIQWKD